jgi:hypothetical protein
MTALVAPPTLHRSVDQVFVRSGLPVAFSCAGGHAAAVLPVAGAWHPGRWSERDLFPQAGRVDGLIPRHAGAARGVFSCPRVSARPVLRDSSDEGTHDHDQRCL